MPWNSTQFEQNLRNWLNRLVEPTRLRESMSYTLLGPGKRIRARLVYATAQALGLEDQIAFHPAAAIEMIHAFTLIHDDLPCLDNDDLRRGLPTNHRKFDEATALLAGDALLALAYETLATTPIDPVRVLKACQQLAWASGPRGVIGGQAAESVLHKQSTLSDLEAMFRGKTGALFSASIGMVLDLVKLPHDSTQGQALLSFADALGFAFQAADDLEDPRPVEGFPYHHLLHYLTPDQASELIQTRLTTANTALELSLGGSAALLTTFSIEIIKKTQKTFLTPESHHAP